MGILEGAAVFLLGMLAARFRPARSGAPEPSAVCGCRHELAYHDPETSTCHAWHKMIGYEPTTCTCRRYDGPQPLSTLYAPEILP